MTGFEWNGDEFMEELREEAARTLLALAITLQTAAKKRLNRSNPPPHDNPAPKGEYPKKRTGFGQASVAIDPPDLKAIEEELAVRVGYDQAAAYMLYLGLKGWKWLEDVMNEEEPKLKRLAGEWITMGVE